MDNEKPVDEMTDEEINLLLATDVMGFKSCRSMMQAKDDDIERAWVGAGGVVIRKRSWNPLNRCEHAWEVFEKMRKGGFSIYMRSNKRGHTVSVSKGIIQKECFDKKSFHRAMVKAALMAKRAEVEYGE